MIYDPHKNGSRSYDRGIKALHDKLWNGFDATETWCVACVLPRAEIRVAAELVRRDYHVWLPMTQGFKTDRLNKRKRVEYQAPLFPGYLFLVLPDRNLYRPQQVGGFSRFIMSDGEPYRLAGHLLAHLHGAEKAGLFDHRCDVTRLQTGTEVEIVLGPLAGHIGKLQSSDGPKRCEVLLDLLGTETKVQVDVANVRAVV